MRGLIKVGLTGGIAAGKSMALRHWQTAGLATIDADELAHQAVAPNTPTWRKVARVFGTGILNKDGTINRPRLGRIVFADARKRETLNRIIHPAVEAMWMTALKQLQSNRQTKIAVVAIPLLYEVAAEKHFDCVVVVGCREETQLVRLKKKGLIKAQALARICAQWPVTMKMDRADFVIWNDGRLKTLYQQAEIILTNIKEMTHAASKN